MSSPKNLCENLTAAEIENKLDEDFIFYLGFAQSFMKHVSDDEVKRKCEQWLMKLCGEPVRGVELKRCRNIYLSQLLLCMQSGNLAKEFTVPIHAVNIGNAEEVFQLTADENIEKPAWLDDNDYLPSEESSKKGRTYLATRTLPDGQGAFAYIAVSLGDEELKWLGGGEGVFDRHMEQKYREEVPEYEVERILARRKDPKEREKVVTFYTILLQNIEDELDEKVSPFENPTINGLVEQLEQDLRDRDQFDCYANLDEANKRIELLLLLHDRIKRRVNKVEKREELLDEIENTLLTKSLFETSVLNEDRYELPATMWEQAINKAPNKKHLEKLEAAYPNFLILKFLTLLSNRKEDIAMRMQRRYENIASQMKKELRREDTKGKKMVEEAQVACDHAVQIRNAVKDAFEKKIAAEKANEDQLNVPQSEHSKLYDEMRAALYDTQKSVENEAARGRQLAAQISLVNEQTEMYAKVTEETIRQIEETNMVTMKNVKRLNQAIQFQQERITKLQKTVQEAGKKSNTDAFNIYF